MGTAFRLMEPGKLNPYRADSRGFHNFITMGEMILSSQRLIEHGAGA